MSAASSASSILRDLGKQYGVKSVCNSLYCAWKTEQEMERAACNFCGAQRRSMSGVMTDCGRWACGSCALDLETLDDTRCFVCAESIRDQEYLWQGADTDICCKHCVAARPLCNQCTPLLQSKLTHLLVQTCFGLAAFNLPVLVVLEIAAQRMGCFCKELPYHQQWLIAQTVKHQRVRKKQ